MNSISYFRNTFDSKNTENHLLPSSAKYWKGTNGNCEESILLNHMNNLVIICYYNKNLFSKYFSQKFDSSLNTETLVIDSDLKISKILEEYEASKSNDYHPFTKILSAGSRSEKILLIYKLEFELKAVALRLKSDSFDQIELIDSKILDQNFIEKNDDKTEIIDVLHLIDGRLMIFLKNINYRINLIELKKNKSVQDFTLPNHIEIDTSSKINLLSQN